MTSSDHTVVFVEWPYVWPLNSFSLDRRNDTVAPTRCVALETDSVHVNGLPPLARRACRYSRPSATDCASMAPPPLFDDGSNDAAVRIASTYTRGQTAFVLDSPAEAASAAANSKMTISRFMRIFLYGSQSGRARRFNGSRPDRSRFTSFRRCLS